MEKEPQMVLVEADVLPAVFLKVLEAKKLISKGISKNSSEACKAVDISRSAFYKYKDSVFWYENPHHQKTVTLYFRLIDEPGVLSAVLSKLYQCSVNILTVNQNIPIDGAADVTITVRIDNEKTDLKNMKEYFLQADGIVEFKKI